jgi:hypothetical protein
MGKKKTSIQIRQEQREASRLACQRALVHARERAKTVDLGRNSRKEGSVLVRYIGAAVRGQFALRSVDTFRSRHYNLSRQVLRLIDHVFCYYQVPHFLYRAMLSREGLALVFGLEHEEEEIWRESGKRRFVRWFAVAAQGGSLAKEMKGILTKKEVHWFLKAPDLNSIRSNLFWAKCAATGIPLTTCQFLTEQLGSKEQQRNLGARTEDLIRFYAAECQDLRGNDLKEITDFVRAMIWEASFSFKGRTHSSMVKLSNEWHQSIYSTKVTTNRSWSQTFAPWLHKRKDHCVQVVELISSRALADEGRKQRHCVFSYEQDCIRNSSKIVSMRWIGPTEGLMHEAEILNRVTIEVDLKSRAIVQIRGRCNRSADEHEMKVIRVWAGDHGLKIEDWA